MKFFKKKSARKEDPQKNEIKYLRNLISKMPEPKTIQGVLNNSSKKEIIKRKEYPSLGHALDKVKKDWISYLSSSAFSAYLKGYFHMIPLNASDSGQIDNLAISVKDEHDNIITDIYNQAGRFLLLEIAYPREFRKIRQHMQKHTSKEQFVNEITFIEPGISSIIPEMLVQISYEKWIAYRIFEFSSHEETSTIIDTSRMFFEKILSSKLKDESQVSKYIHYEEQKESSQIINKLLMITIPGSKNHVIAKLMWQLNNLLFSGHYEGILKRKNFETMGYFRSIQRMNTKFLK